MCILSSSCRITSSNSIHFQAISRNLAHDHSVHDHHDHGSVGSSGDADHLEAVLKGLVALSCIFFFFLIERVLTIVTEKKRRKKSMVSRGNSSSPASSRGSASVTVLIWQIMFSSVSTIVLFCLYHCSFESFVFTSVVVLFCSIFHFSYHSFALLFLFIIILLSLSSASRFCKVFYLFHHSLRVCVWCWFVGWRRMQADQHVLLCCVIKAHLKKHYKWLYDTEQNSV